MGLLKEHKKKLECDVVNQEKEATCYCKLRGNDQKETQKNQDSDIEVLARGINAILRKLEHMEKVQEIILKKLL